MMNKEEILELASEYEDHLAMLDQRKLEVMDPVLVLQCQSELNEIHTAVMVLNRVLEGNLKEGRGT